MRSLERMLAVFESFTADKTILTLQEIADRNDLPKSTIFRIVRSLEEAGYLVRLDNHRYCLSFRFTRLAGFVNSTLDLRTVSRPVLQQLAEETQETVSIHQVMEASRVCLDTITRSDAPLRSVAQPGQHLPLGTGSVSKVLLAFMGAADRARIFDDVVAESGRDREAWTAELEAIRTLGHAVSHGERQLGLSGISAPVFQVDGEATYCLTVAGPTANLTAREAEFVPLVLEGARAISLQMGGETRR